MQTSMQPNFSGLGSYWARRHPDARLRQLEKEQTRQLKAAQAKLDAEAFQQQHAQIREALSEILFEDRHGAFCGWDLLLLTKKSRDRIGSIDKDRLAAKLTGVTEPAKYHALMQRFVRLGLIENHPRWPSISWNVTDRGHQALKMFRKEFRKPRFKVGNYTFN